MVDSYEEILSLGDEDSFYDKVIEDINNFKKKRKKLFQTLHENFFMEEKWFSKIL